MSNTFKFIKTRSGFTLIELLVVIAIIVILISASLIGISGSRETARDAKRKADLEAIRGALEIYKSDANQYPTEDTCDSSRGSCGACPCGGSDWGGDISAKLEPNYITNLPTDPINDTTYYFYYEPVCGETSSICGANRICPTGNCCAYELRAYLETTSLEYKICSP